jgi:thiol-disulfide isomerase/thioredoxin
MRNYLCIFLFYISFNVHAEEVTSLVEFFSYGCSHCAGVNSTLANYVHNKNIKFIAINVDQSEAALPTNIMYMVAEDAGLGFKFQQEYFNAIRSGMVMNSKQILDYVVSRISTPKYQQLLQDKDERNLIKQKIKLSHELLSKFPVQVTPSFLLNGVTLLEGEDIIKSLYWSK